MKRARSDARLVGAPPVGEAVALPFDDRHAAGVLLARRLVAEGYADRDVMVLALPRGGVPLADEVARALNAPLDVVVVRKLGAPGYEEVAMGAVAPGGVRVLNPTVAPYFSSAQIDAETASELAELARRERVFRGGRPPPVVAGKIVLLVDDGLATGATMRAALEWARRARAAEVIVAVPVAAPEAVTSFQGLADAVVCLAQPEDFEAVGRWYREFRQLDDAEVVAILEAAWRAPSSE